VHPTEHTHSLSLETLFHTNGCRVDLGHIFNPFHLFSDDTLLEEMVLQYLEPEMVPSPASYMKL